MDSLTKDVLFNIATMLDLDNLLNFCNSDSRINKLVCQGEDIWLFKLVREFPDWKQLNMKPRESYELLVALTKLKREFKYRKNIYELYKETELNLSYKRITSLPSEIGNLSNLHTLWLCNNQIITLPSEIGNLTSLQFLTLHNNQIITLPSEISKLKQLRTLWLYNNQITTLPSEIGNLTSLQQLYLDKNVVVPSELQKFSVSSKFVNPLLL